MAGYEKPDFWADKAKKEGYAARSVYKLMELDDRFGLFAKARAVLDLGAAPGSWSQWALRRLGGKGFLVAVDLSPLAFAIDADRGLALRGDMGSEEVRTAVAAKAPFDLVLSDAAPATSGNRGLDTARSEALVELAIEYAAAMLRPGGAMAAKIFQGGGERGLLESMRALFDDARAFKPKACRSESFETYLVGRGFKGGV
jgi:23S rRNA (uridine2552-2'-O)-methyltransferase